MNNCKNILKYTKGVFISVLGKITKMPKFVFKLPDLVEIALQGNQIT